MLPPDASSIVNRTLEQFDAPTLTLDEKLFVLTLLKIYFGPAREAVRDVSSPESLRHLGEVLRQPGERYDVLERDTSLPDGYFRSGGAASGLYGSKVGGGGSPSRYFIYSGELNVTGYLGPDFLHGDPSAVTVNCVLLDSHFEPTESHTLRV